MKIEQFEGSYSCLICYETCRRGNGVLRCMSCTVGLIHRGCVGDETNFPECKRNSLIPWDNDSWFVEAKPLIHTKLRHVLEQLCALLPTPTLQETVGKYCLPVPPSQFALEALAEGLHRCCELQEPVSPRAGALVHSRVPSW